MNQFSKSLLITLLTLSVLKLAAPLSFAAKPSVDKHTKSFAYQNEVHFSAADLDVISNIISGTHQTKTSNRQTKRPTRVMIADTMPSISNFIKQGVSRHNLDNTLNKNDDSELYQSSSTTQIAALNPSAGSYLGFSQPVQATIWNFISRYNKSLTPPQVSQISNNILEMSSLFQVDPHLITGLLAVESSFNPYAISTSGAMGLGQLKPDTAEWLGIQDPFDPRQNVYASTKYLRFLLDKYQGNAQYALGAYYRGQGAVDRQGLDEGAISYANRVNRMISQI